MKGLDEIHDMVQTTMAGDTDRILDILLELVEQLKNHEENINGFGRRLDAHVTKRHGSSDEN